MPLPQKVELQGKERELKSFVYRDWTAVNTTNARNAIPANCFYNCENLQPIGFSNLHTVPGISAALWNYGTDIVYWDTPVNINGVLWNIVATTNGKLFAYNFGSPAAIQINGANTLSGSGTRITQWKNQVALIIDSTGYYVWTGSGNITLITGSGVPTAGNDIAVYSGRVWIVSGRLLLWSIVDNYDGTSWTAAGGAGFKNLTDPVLVGNVTRLYAANGYLYYFGVTSINAISDVYVAAGASPPTPTFTDLNLIANVGTDQPASVFTYGRPLMFMTRFGMRALFGVSAPSISTIDENNPYASGIDGTIQYVDYSQAISGGTCVVNNILCCAFLIKRLNDPTFGSNTVLAMFQLSAAGYGKWWFANYGAVTRITTALVGNAPSLFGYIGNQFFQLFANPSTAPNATFSSPLWDFNDPLSIKEFVRVGFQISSPVISGSFTLSVDTTTGSTQVPTLSNAGAVTWINNSGNAVQWANTVPQIVNWIGNQYLLYSGQAPGGFDTYVGLTFTSNGSIYEMNALLMDYKLGSRWGARG